jgi:hypothetical protein
MRTIRIADGACAVMLLLVLGACGGAANSPDSSSTPPGPNPPNSDTTAPAVSITSPTGSGSYSTTSTTVSLTGTASDNVGVVSVTWSNLGNGTNGSASGTGSWNIASIALAQGANQITVTAHDAAGNIAGATLTATSSPGGPVSLSGSVDSSLINRSGGTSTVYIYSGTVVPTGATPPFATAPVTQDNGACTFSYQFVSLPGGVYTLAFSSDATTFRGAATLALPTTPTHDFPPNRLLRVGPTRTVGPTTFKVPSAAITAAQAGDVIEIDAADYVDDNAQWSTNNLTLRGAGGARPHLRSTQLINNGSGLVNGKGIWVPQAQNVVVENVEFSGATVQDKNGAGIRNEANNLTVCNGYFHDNENGILGGGGTVLIEYSEFDHNGQCPPNFGCAHNMYIDGGNLFTLRYSYTHRAHEGHTVKSRAKENHILYNRIMSEEGDTSYEINLPNGGLSFIIGNLIQQGPNTGNPTIIQYGEDGVPADGRKNEIYIVNNTIVNDLPASIHPGTFVSLSGGPTAFFVNNIFAGGGGVPSGAGITSTTNLSTPTSSTGLVNAAVFDYHLTSTSPARNAGTDPGAAASFSLAPTSQYVHPTNRQDRPINGTIDIGAYEFQ